MSWIIYRIGRPSNDLKWLRVFAEVAESTVEDGDHHIAAIMDAEMEAAMDAAREHGWDGEMDEEPHLFVLPHKDTFKFGFVWTTPDVERPTLIASPIPLPWLEA
jgi:hypothetical protein